MGRGRACPAFPPTTIFIVGFDVSMEDWDAASQQFSAALSSNDGRVRPEMLAPWARAILRSSTTWDAKINELAVLSSAGFHHPEHWTLTVQAYFQVLDHHQRGISSEAREFVSRLRAIVADTMASGIAIFRSLQNAGDRSAYPWGAALVFVADWLLTCEVAEDGNRAKHPYRTIAAALYLPVAECELSLLFDDQTTMRDIDEHLTCRARLQISRLEASTPIVRPTRAARLKQDPASWTLFALRSMS